MLNEQELVDKARSLIFGTIIADGYTFTTISGKNADINKDIITRRAKINLIVMCRETALDLIRARALELSRDSSKSDHIFGVRVAYDEGMRYGEMAVAEAIYG
jgi:hypothetical protein